jgi:glutamyl-tRNA reductase
VAEEAESFREWRASREVVPAIASLRAWAEEIRAAELDRVRGRLSESQEAVVESITARIVDKLLHPPTVRLKEAAAGVDGGSYAQAVRHLFDLGDE